MDRGHPVKQPLLHIKRKEVAPLAAFSFFIALSVVLSNHIQITGNTYSGLATQNYISLTAPPISACCLQPSP